jgi:hypothetical protein
MRTQLHERKKVLLMLLKRLMDGAIWTGDVGGFVRK